MIDSGDVIMLEGANRNSVTRYKSGLQQVASAFGIVGEQWNIVEH